jgi:1-acyl-sn-glycerol-3-phosphate acyltransferase
MLYRVARTVLVGFARLYWRLRVTGASNVPPRGAYVVAPVHRSNVDFIAAASITRRRLRYMGKDSLWRVPLLRWLISALGAFPVRRESADREAFRRCVEVLGSGEPLVVFPEGARQSGSEVKPLHQGAAYLALRAGVPIVPVGIGGSEAAMPKGSKLLRPARIRVVVGRPIEAERREGRARASRSDVARLSERLHAVLQSLYDEASARAGA